jgi:aspartate carbamoyltransferase catalytic subunit
MQKERHEGANFIPSMREYIANYCVGLDHVSKDQKVLHPGPINRGIEIAADLADSQENLILQQVEAGLAVRMAILLRSIVDSAASEIEEQSGEKEPQETEQEPADPKKKSGRGNIRAVG